MSKDQKKALHPNNKHQLGYDLDRLCSDSPNLKTFVFQNAHGQQSVDFSNPKAVKALNAALLKTHYNIVFWEFPDAHLCPAIPGRVDYLHYVKDLLDEFGITEAIRVLDIGTGANCIYPLLGVSQFNWKFVASEVDENALAIAQQILNSNELQNHVDLRLQKNSRHILRGILNESDRISVCICNPPFYKSEGEAISATSRKLKGLQGKGSEFVRNFSGTASELWCKGGEAQFLDNYVYESELYKEQCQWFTTLVSKKEHIRPLKVKLKRSGVKQTKVIKMQHGNKESRILAWTFMDMV